MDWIYAGLEVRQGLRSHIVILYIEGLGNQSNYSYNEKEEID